MSTTTETPAEALARIQSQVSKNDFAAIVQFANCGIHPDDITPRVNVLTFKAWKALGRRVAKGATGQRVTVWVSVEKAGKPDGVRPISAVLFHESQTIAEDAEKGTRPAAWENAQLVKAGTYEAAAEPTTEPAEETPEDVVIMPYSFTYLGTDHPIMKLIATSGTKPLTPGIPKAEYLADLAPEPMPAAAPTAAPAAKKQTSLF